MFLMSVHTAAPPAPPPYTDTPPLLAVCIWWLIQLMRGVGGGNILEAHHVVIVHIAVPEERLPGWPSGMSRLSPIHRLGPLRFRAWGRILMYFTSYTRRAMVYASLFCFKGSSSLLRRLFVHGLHRPGDLAGPPRMRSAAFQHSGMGATTYSGTFGLLCGGG